MKTIPSQKARPAKLPSALMRGLPSSTRVMFTPKSGGPQVADDGDDGDGDGEGNEDNDDEKDLDDDMSVWEIHKILPI